jgi:hypothetical protein
MPPSFRGGMLQSQKDTNTIKTYKGKEIYHINSVKMT